MDLQQLRHQHPTLVYRGYQAIYQNSSLTLKYNFLLEPDIVFQPELIIPQVESTLLVSKDPALLDRLFFNLGLAEIPSYWKAACSPQIKIISHSQQQLMSTEQLAWWHDLLIKGMSEFYFTNQIDFTQENWISLQAVSADNSETMPDYQAIEFLDTKQDNQTTAQPSAPIKTPYLIPVGGGKDSALSLGILDDHQLKYACLLLQPQSPSAQEIVKLSHCRQTIRLERKLDPRLLELNSQGYLNGHTPFSAYLAFASTLAAYLFNCQQILVANERSANEGNTTYLGMTVNHQYSKSFAFEENFRSYAQQFLFAQQTEFPEYLSLLRPLWEIQIAQLFSHYPEYFSSFKSCNVGQKANIWCEACSKCLFVFMMLSPFVDSQVLSTQIFSHNLFTDEKLLPLAKQLLGLAGHKPFDCVGTYQETQAACYLAIKKYQAEKQDLPFILAQLEKTLSEIADLEKTSQQLLTDWNNQHFVPDSLAQIIKNQLQ